MNELKLIRAEVQDVNVKNLTFNVMLSFKNSRQAKLYCRKERDGLVSAYNLDVVAGKCPCCGKPNCTSLYSKREELLNEAQKLTKFPEGMETVQL